MKKKRFFLISCGLSLLALLLNGCVAQSNDSASLGIHSDPVLMEEKTALSPSSEGGNMGRDETVSYSYETRELYAERDGMEIYGVAYIPQGAGKKCRR